MTEETKGIKKGQREESWIIRSGHQFYF